MDNTPVKNRKSMYEKLSEDEKTVVLYDLQNISFYKLNHKYNKYFIMTQVHTNLLFVTQSLHILYL